MITPKISLTEAAENERPRGLTPDAIEAVKVLRGKQYSWRECAAWLNHRGVVCDYTKLFRLLAKHEE